MALSQQLIGFVGLGRMGSRMATRLLNAGHGIVMHDTNAAALEALERLGARRLGSAREVADAAPTVFASLPTPAIVHATALGADGVINGKGIKTFVDVSTTGPRVAKQVAEGLAARGIVALDCPVSGGLAGAANGTLALMVSGDKARFEALQPVLAVLGKIFFIGEQPGAGQMMKLTNNLLAAAAIAITSEAMVMGVKAGLDPSVMCDVFNVSSGRNSATQDKFPRSVIPGTFDFGFATGLSYKDVRLCLDEAEALGVPTPVGAAVRQMLSITNALYGPESDFTSMVRPIETWAGVEVRSKK
jgi:3-hydroxyisobutyrate dehydrogenase-like beta-hydroxyacid dehydrogenase